MDLGKTVETLYRKMDSEGIEMRKHGLTVLFCLVVIGFFALVAAVDYSWTSREAYVQVRTAELALIVIGFAVFYLVMGISFLVDWCHLKLDQIRRRKRR